MEKGNVYISGEYINEYNHRIDIIWCIYVCKVRAIWIFGVCNEVGGRQAVCKMFSIYLVPNILETSYSFAPWDSQVALSGEKKRDGDGWEAKCHNSLSSSLSYITQTFSDCIEEKTIHDLQTNVVLAGLDKMEDFEENIL